MTKAEILAVGSFDDNGQPINWGFAGRGAGLTLPGTPEELIRYAGYTVEELHEIRAAYDSQKAAEGGPAELGEVLGGMIDEGRKVGAHRETSNEDKTPDSAVEDLTPDEEPLTKGQFEAYAAANRVTPQRVVSGEILGLLARLNRLEVNALAFEERIAALEAFERSFPTMDETTRWEQVGRAWGPFGFRRERRADG